MALKYVAAHSYSDFTGYLWHALQQHTSNQWANEYKGGFKNELHLLPRRFSTALTLSFKMKIKGLKKINKPSLYILFHIYFIIILNYAIMDFKCLIKAIKYHVLVWE